MMNVQGIGQNIPTRDFAQQSDPRLKSIDQQVSDLQKRISEVRGNEKLDLKSKTEKIKEYEQQIQLLQQEKAQIQAEKRQSQQKTTENVQSLANQDVKNENSFIDSSVQNALTKIDSAKKMDQAVGVVQEQLKGKLRKAESTSYLAAPDPEAAAELRGKLAKIDRTAISIISEAAEELEKPANVAVSVSKDGLREEEADRENNKSGTGRMEPGQFLDEEA